MGTNKKMCERNQNEGLLWVRDVSSKEIGLSFIFRDGQSVHENGDVLSKKDRFVRGTFFIKKFLGCKIHRTFVRGRFVRVPYNLFK
jgi:hypothetical protein